MYYMLAMILQHQLPTHPIILFTDSNSWSQSLCSDQKCKYFLHNYNKIIFITFIF